ncbi:hypothetical protein [Bosea sp. RAC05]|uniref:hypothetical protein n=1 Tax=Bosea sp. RAC05 TaxID=1842539 RepID=UPI00083E6A83|nr:hypothetical protein [Bosea sp. RAC05]AOG03381.1 hypothetical protein BSY19_4722 [Bosea sp. RAC05]
MTQATPSKFEYDVVEPVVYDGTWYRSRNEAKWAAFFDLVKWDVAYEEVRTGIWWPDFTFSGPSDRKIFAEVKPINLEAGWPDDSSKVIMQEKLILKMRDALQRGLCDEAILLPKTATNFRWEGHGVIGLRLFPEPREERSGFARDWEHLNLRILKDGSYEYDAKDAPPMARDMDWFEKRNAHSGRFSRAGTKEVKALWAQANARVLSLPVVPEAPTEVTPSPAP